jgi:hypothetical protein
VTVFNIYFLNFVYAQRDGTNERKSLCHVVTRLYRKVYCEGRVQITTTLLALHPVHKESKCSK